MNEPRTLPSLNGTELATEEPFVPRYLTPQQNGQLYTEDLMRVEARVRAAWAGLLAARREYREAQEQLREMEADRERVLATRAEGAE